MLVGSHLDLSKNRRDLVRGETVGSSAPYCLPLEAACLKLEFYFWKLNFLSAPMKNFLIVALYPTTLKLALSVCTLKYLKSSEG